MTLISAYARLTGLAEGTISSKVFGDGKKIGLLRAGKDLTTGRMDGAILWFSRNWPKEAVWPAKVNRPRRPSSKQFPVKAASTRPRR